MRNLPLALGLILVLLLLLVFARMRPEAPASPGAAPDEPLAAELPADQLIAAAAGRAAADAWFAYRALEQAGRCPYLADSPETPIGMLTAAYGTPDSEVEHVREAIRLLVRQGCDINQYNAAGLTPLHNAVLFRQPALLRFLLEQGADPRLRVIAIPGRETGHRIAHLDAYGMAQVLRDQHPDDDAVHEIVELLKPAA
jgi:hypothetical protein